MLLSVKPSIVVQHTIPDSYTVVCYEIFLNPFVHVAQHPLVSLQDAISSEEKNEVGGRVG